MRQPSLRERHTIATRRSIERSARKLFVGAGYVATSVEKISEHAGVTTGAVYHHFRSKRDIMIAVLKMAEREIVDRVMASAVGLTNPLERFSAGNRAFLITCNEPKIARIALHEAPIALGWERWREIDDAFSLDLVRRGLNALVKARVISSIDVDLVASVLLAGLMEAGAKISRARDPESLIDTTVSAFEKMVLGLGTDRS